MPAFAAAKYGHTESLAALIAAGADINIQAEVFSNYFYRIHRHCIVQFQFNKYS